jgi:hypothetical protein
MMGLTSKKRVMWTTLRVLLTQAVEMYEFSSPPHLHICTGVCLSIMCLLLDIF